MAIKFKLTLEVAWDDNPLEMLCVWGGTKKQMVHALGDVPEQVRRHMEEVECTIQDIEELMDKEGGD